MQILLIEDENWYLSAYPSGECLSLVDSQLGTEPISKEEWLVEKSYDSLCQSLRTNAERNPSSGFLIRADGLLVRKAILGGRHQMVVPKGPRDRIPFPSHNPAMSGHSGSKRMYLTMRQEYYWPSMVIDLYKSVSRCVSCKKDRIDMKKRTNLLKLFPAQAPLESVALHLLGPLPKSKSEYRFVLVMVNRFTKLCRFKALRSTTRSENC